MATGNVIRTIYELPKPDVKTYVRAIAFAPNGKMLAFGFMDTIILADPATGKKLGQLEAKMGQVTDLAFTLGSKKLVSNGTSGQA